MNEIQNPNINLIQMGMDQLTSTGEEGGAAPEGAESGENTSTQEEYQLAEYVPEPFDENIIPDVNWDTDHPNLIALMNCRDWIRDQMDAGTFILNNYVKDGVTSIKFSETGIPIRTCKCLKAQCAVGCVRALLDSDADSAMEDHNLKLPLYYATDNNIKKLLWGSQIEPVPHYAQPISHCHYPQWKIGGLPTECEPAFVKPLIQRLFQRRAGVQISLDNIEIHEAALTGIPSGTAIVKYQTKEQLLADPKVKKKLAKLEAKEGETQVKSRGNALSQLMNTPELVEMHKKAEKNLHGVIMYDERQLNYKNKSKFMHDIQFKNNLTVDWLDPHGDAHAEGVCENWQLVAVNCRYVYPPWGEVEARINGMKEKQSLLVELRNPRALGKIQGGRITCELVTHFE